MKAFVTVTQVSANKFDVEFVSALSLSRVKTVGILITVWERDTQNEKYCFELCEKMNNQ